MINLNNQLPISTSTSYLHQTVMNRAVEKLSSGLKINRAADDAAGLAISQKMRGQIRGLQMAGKNAQDAISLLQTTDGALAENHSILQRARELTIQAATDSLTDDDRKLIQLEVDQLLEEIDSISNRTEFNTMKVLDGSVMTKEHPLVMQIGANSNQSLPIILGAGTLGEKGGSSLEALGLGGHTIQIEEATEHIKYELEAKVTIQTTNQIGASLNNNATFQIEGERIIFNYNDSMQIKLEINGKDHVETLKKLRPLAGDRSPNQRLQDIAPVSPSSNTFEDDVQNLVVEFNKQYKNFLVTENIHTAGEQPPVTIKEVNISAEGDEPRYRREFNLPIYTTETATIEVKDNGDGKFSYIVSGTTSKTDLTDTGDYEIFEKDYRMSTEFRGDEKSSDGKIIGYEKLDAFEQELIKKIKDNRYMGSEKESQNWSLNYKNPGGKFVEPVYTMAGEKQVYGLDVTTRESANESIQRVDDAISKISTMRSQIGAYHNRLEHTIKNLAQSSENLTAAESRLADADIAKEMMAFTKAQLLQQTSTAMQANANQQASNLLKLIA